MINKNDSIKYIYYFRGTLDSHVHLYQAWVVALRNNGVPFELVTILGIRTYIKQYKLVKKYKSRCFRIYPSLNIKAFEWSFFILVCLSNKKVVVHLKKRQTRFFDQLKRVFSDKIRYIVEGEGDALSERDFLMKHPFKKDFYNGNLEDLKIQAKYQKNVLINSDHNTVGTLAFKTLLIQRYPEAHLTNKISVVPMTFNKGTLYYSECKRHDLRSKLSIESKFVITYIGNAFYSWQNVYRTIEIFQLLKDGIINNAYLVLLIRKSDHYIVMEFIEKLGLSSSDYLLTHVPHEEIIAYLSASDLGVALRHDHIMNMIAYSGKLLDYLGCGLPVLTTTYNGEEIPKFVCKKEYGVVLNDMDDDSELLNKITKFLNHDKKRRIEISGWANEELSTEAFIGEYIGALSKLF